jgi:recombinational DNA repair protein RecR
MELRVEAFCNTRGIKYVVIVIQTLSKRTKKIFCKEIIRATNITRENNFIQEVRIVKLPVHRPCRSSSG